MNDWYYKTCEYKCNKMILCKTRVDKKLHSLCIEGRQTVMMQLNTIILSISVYHVLTDEVGLFFLLLLKMKSFSGN